MVILGLLAGSIIDIGGYFIAELFMYGLAGAVIDVAANCVQAVASIIVFIVLLPIAAKAIKSFSKS